MRIARTTSVVVLSALFALAGCEGPEGATGATGPEGPEGPAGQPGVSAGTLSGTVVNGLNGAGVADVQITLDPAAADAITTGADGSFTADLPIGAYTATFAREGFGEMVRPVNVVADHTTTVEVTMEPAAPVLVHADGLHVAPGATGTVTATIEAFDGSAASSWEWAHVAGPELTVSGTDTATLEVTAASLEAYKAALAEAVRVPDRLMVLPVNPHAVELAEVSVYEVTVTTDMGETYTHEVEIAGDLDLAWATGLRNVAINIPVILQAKLGDSYAWEITSAPSGSAATLDAADSRWPSFTPDAEGTYTLTETVSGGTLDIIAGTWRGAISGVGEDGNPEMTCGGCHSDETKAITDAWEKSGHAEIFQQNMNDPHNHWSTNCASCHTVGYDGDVANGGFDKAVEDAGWTVPPGAPGLYEEMFSTAEDVAQTANIQCENCHGPNNSDAHMGDAARYSLSSDTCTYCHGEPPRHGRSMQWEESAHGNYELAIDRGLNAHCGRCHAGEGFVHYVQQDDLTLNLQGANGNATEEEMLAWGMGPESVHPITCATCHDPHHQGDTSGSAETNATVRVDGSTKMLPAGFKAVAVGSGALCMTCHNSRVGARGDDMVIAPDTFGGRAPHTASQADVFMGENAFFVADSQRSSHAYIEDTCVACHMELTPPPAEFSYNFGGTNHTFEANLGICAECHGSLDGEGFVESMHGALVELEHYIAGAAMADLNAQLAGGTVLDLAGTQVSNVTVDEVHVIEGHGRMELHLFLSDGTDHAVQLRDLAYADGTLVYGDDTNMSKAMWNFFLLEGDGSAGVHNPGFFTDVISATMRQDLTQ